MTIIQCPSCHMEFYDNLLLQSTYCPACLKDIKTGQPMKGTTPMADTALVLALEMVRADIAFKEQLNKFFSDGAIANAVYHNRHELFIMLTDWSTRIEQGTPEGKSGHE